jgi:hypothetical protein
MPTNMRMLERAIRVVLGIMLLGLYGALPSPWRYLTMIGLVPIATGITGFCPAYHYLRRHDNASASGGTP